MGSKSILVVGAGFAGATIAEVLANKGFKVTVIDQRDHIAGNAYDFINKHGIRIHKYGAHIFHSNNKKIFQYLSRFTKWVQYQHKVVAQINKNEHVIFPPTKSYAETVGIDFVIQKFYKPYTEKMWGLKIDQLDPTILLRVPIRNDDGDLYFPKDKYQGLPEQGYTQLITNMLDHKNITVNLNEPFHKSMESKFDHIFNSMPIDVYYDYCFGQLPYRSIKFNHQDIPSNQGTKHTVINFTDHNIYTRLIEWKNFPGHSNDIKTSTVTYEQPCDYRDNNMERYYPVKDLQGHNRRTYNRYRRISNAKMTFIGRCGQYVYLDMDQVVSSSLSIANEFCNSETV